MKKQFKISHPVFPLPIGFHKGEIQSVDFEGMSHYLIHLHNKGTQVIMTQNGRTRFNLLSFTEVLAINRIISECWEGQMILGVPLYHNKKAKSFIEALLSEVDPSKPTALFLSYPDYFYTGKEVVEYLHDLASFAGVPCFFDGHHLINGANGAQVDYTTELIREISSHDNICGMRENSVYLSNTGAIIKEASEDFSVILSGGLLKYLAFIEEPTPGVSYTTRIGSLFPTMDIRVKNMLEKKNISGLSKTKLIEREVFEVFAKIGIERSIGEALVQMGFYEQAERSPVPPLDEKQKIQIKNILKEHENSCN